MTEDGIERIGRVRCRCAEIGTVIMKDPELKIEPWMFEQNGWVKGEMLGWICPKCVARGRRIADKMRAQGQMVMVTTAPNTAIVTTTPMPSPEQMKTLLERNGNDQQ